MGRRRASTAQVAAAAARAAVEAAEDQAAGATTTVELEDGVPEGQIDALASLAQLGEGEEYFYVLECAWPLDKKGMVETDLTREDLPDLPAYIKQRYGAGRYRVYARGPKGFIAGSNRKITISSLAQDDGTGRAAGTSALAPAGGGTDLQQWMALQEQRDERRRAEAREDQKFYLQLFAPLLMKLVSPPSLADQMAVLTGMKGLAGDGGPEKVIEMLSKGLELGKELAGSGGNETPWTVVRDIVKDLTPAGQQLLDRIAARAPGTPAGPRAPAGAPAKVPVIPYKPAPAAGPPAAGPAGPPAAGPAPEAPSSGEDPMFDTHVKPLLKRLAVEAEEYAQNGAAPELAAHALIAKIPRMLRAFVKPEQLKEWLTQSNWWQVVAEFHPGLVPYQGFCDDVRQTLIAVIDEEMAGSAEEAVP